uniref:Borealin C-terminal domain-containing protein n=1 Tax=Rhodnius prolixus TaxID=13249 RepID=T1HHH3_RHOPR
MFLQLSAVVDTSEINILIFSGFNFFWSKSSALKVDTKCDTRNLTPVKRVDYKIASVTPKPNLKSEPSILRKPKAGETVISMTGSPLLVSSFQGPTQIPQLSIPIDQERVLTVLGRESLDVSNFPCVDPLTRARLAKLHNFLGQVLEDKN